GAAEYGLIHPSFHEINSGPEDERAVIQYVFTRGCLRGADVLFTNENEFTFGYRPVTAVVECRPDCLGVRRLSRKIAEHDGVEGHGTCHCKNTHVRVNELRVDRHEHLV